MSSQFFVKGDDHTEEELGRLYQEYELAAALTDFLERVQTDEAATLTWSS